MLFNCGVEDLRVPWTARRSNQSILKKISPEYSIRSTDAEAETSIFRPHDAKNWLIGKDPDWERLKAGGEEDDKGWNSWMASLTWWTWIWSSSGGWWWTGKPGVLRSMGSQRVRHDWVTELNWVNQTDWILWKFGHFNNLIRQIFRQFNLINHYLKK